MRALAHSAGYPGEAHAGRDVQLRGAAGFADVVHAAAELEPDALHQTIGDALDVDLAAVRVAREDEVGAATGDRGAVIGRVAEHEARDVVGCAGECGVEVVVAGGPGGDPAPP